MNILFLTDNFPPESNAPAKRTFEHSSVWANLGHKVTVITSVPNFPEGKVFSGYKNKIYQTETINQIFVKRVWTYIAANRGFILRIIDYISFMFSSTICGIFTKKHDIIIATSPQFFTLLAGYFISVFKKTPLAVEIRDLWPESIVAVGAMKDSSFVIKFFYKIAFFIYKKSKIIFCVTDLSRNYLIEKGIDSNKIVVIKNGFNFENTLKPSETIKNIEKQYKIDSQKFIVSYIGTIGMAHGLDVVIRAAEKIEYSHQDIFFLIIGEGAEKDKMKKDISNKNLKNILVLDRKNWQEIVNINQTVSSHLVHLNESDLFKTVIPSKIFESMALKKPIIAGIQGEGLQLIEQSASGIVMEINNEDSLIEKALFLKKNLTEANKMAINGYNFVRKNYDRKNLAKEMINNIKLNIN